MCSCYIYQPQYLGAALSRTNGLPTGDAITGSGGGGTRVPEEMGTWQGSVLLATAPQPPPQGQQSCRLQPGSVHQTLPLFPTDWEELPRILSQRSPQSSLCLPFRVFFP